MAARDGKSRSATRFALHGGNVVASIIAITTMRILDTAAPADLASRDEKDSHRLAANCTKTGRKKPLFPDAGRDRSQQTLKAAYRNRGTVIARALRTDIASRLDDLPWSAWHLRVLCSLAVTWLLDGLEGSLGGTLAGSLSLQKSRGGLGLSDAQLGLSSSLYLAGAVFGALLFGYMADRWGRRRLFFWTLALYVTAASATAFSWNLASFTACRMLTGAGIGGEYAAINSAVDELMPARLRGRVDLWINGTFWVGIILGSAISVRLLTHPVLAQISSWRLAFCAGLPIALLVMLSRRVIPESPRWLLARGDQQGAEESMAAIESAVLRVSVEPRDQFFREVPRPTRKIDLRVLWRPQFRRRTLLCLVLMIAQAFFYNSVFFSLSLVLLRFYAATNEQIGHCFTAISLANALGPWLLGWGFDSIGRRKMIGATYSLSGIVLANASVLFLKVNLNFTTQVALWAIMFFFASTAASSAYLTVSEVFPQRIRASAIALFYALGTSIGGICGPLIFGHLIGTGQKELLFKGYLVGAACMFLAGFAAMRWGIDAERRSLEDLTEVCDLPHA